jgi:hypothetical protein
MDNQNVKSIAADVIILKLFNEDSKNQAGNSAGCKLFFQGG